MSKITNIAIGVVTDPAGFADLIEKATAIVRAELPGTERYEFHFDQQAGRFVGLETYRDDEAVLQHAGRMAEAGMLERVQRCARFEGGFLLGDVGPEVQAALEPMGFQFFPVSSGTEVPA